MAIQSYGGSGLFGQPSFGDYSGLSGGVPVPMTLEEIQKQLDKQRLQDYENLYANKYESPESSAFNANINSRYIGLPTNPYVNTPRDPLRTPLSQADYIKQQEGNPVLAVDQMSVNNEPSSNLPTAPVASVQQVAIPAAALVPQQSIVQGMFPEVDAMQRALYQQKQNEAMRDRFTEFAKLSPLQQASVGFQQAGYQLGQGVGGALGGQDPQLQMIGLQQQILKELDPSNPNQQLQVAQKYAQVAPDLAMKIADNARSSLVKIAQANKERQASVAPDVQKAERAASITQAISQYKALPQTPEIAQAIQTLQAQLDFLKPKAEATPNEIQLAQAFAGEKGVKGTPEYNAEYVSQLLRLTDQKENIIDVGVADKTRKVVYFDKKSDQQFTMEPDSTGKLVRTPYSGGIDKTTAKVSATASSKQAEAVNKGKVDMASSIEESAFSASDRISLAQSLRELAPKAFTGFAADAKLTASKVASAFGIPTKGGSESEIIDQILGQMTLGSAGQLKGSLSDKDVLFLKKTIGTRGLSVNTLLFVADEIERMAAQDRHLNKRINEVTRTGGNLNEINFEEEKSKSASYVKQQMSDYRNILKKVQNNTATLEEATKARQIRDQLGLQ